jgi:phosphatidylserine/phosphatidylglycerophosphate/cardiolipin synthase-like enzyme
VRISELLAQTARTLDVVAFELNNQAITMAILDAHRRGVAVRVVADNEHTIEDEGTTMNLLVDAGIPIVYDKRTAFMHNKFMILDSTYVITGSTNWTVNDVYRNNNNLLVMRTRRAVDAYQNVFNKMFDEGQFGPRRVGPNASEFTVDGIPVEIHFSPEDGVVNAIQEQLALAQHTIRFMAFSFTEDRLGLTLLDRATSGVRVEGIFETRGSETQYSELRLLYCAGLDVRQDGNPRTMHHKVFIVDDTHVITGSFNFSANAIESNDENLVIIHDPELARQYIAEYERVKSVSSIPSSIVCN